MYLVSYDYGAKQMKCSQENPFCLYILRPHESLGSVVSLLLGPSHRKATPYHGTGLEIQTVDKGNSKGKDSGLDEPRVLVLGGHLSSTGVIKGEKAGMLVVKHSSPRIITVG